MRRAFAGKIGEKQFWSACAIRLARPARKMPPAVGAGQSRRPVDAACRRQMHRHLVPHAPAGNGRKHALRAPDWAESCGCDEDHARCAQRQKGIAILRQRQRRPPLRHCRPRLRPRVLAPYPSAQPHRREECRSRRSPHKGAAYARASNRMRQASHRSSRACPCRATASLRCRTDRWPLSPVMHKPDIILGQQHCSDLRKNIRLMLLAPRPAWAR